jgi:hypothetical protein
MIKSFTVLFVLFSIPALVYAQTIDSDSTTMYYLHLKPLKHDKNIKYEFLCSRGEWQSPYLTPIVDDTLGIIIKLYIPVNVFEPEMVLRCKAIAKNISNINNTDDYKLERNELLDLNIIQLSIISNPRNVAIFMIPTRVWLNEIKKTNWKKDTSLIAKYLLDESFDTKNLVVGIDDTEYTLIFKSANKYIIKTHKVQPGKERVQYEKADFTKKLFSD